MKCIFFILTFIFSFQLSAQQATDPSLLIKVNDIMPITDFREIRSFVWNSGDRKTYCPNYSNNPHFELTEDEVEIYFNPSSQRKEGLVETDYNIMYIVTRFKETPFNYYLYLTDNGDILLYDYNKYLRNEGVKSAVLKQLKTIVNRMNNEMKSNS